MTHPMNMPYISLQTAFQIIDEVANDLDSVSKSGKSSDERQWGRAGLAASLRIKKDLIKEVKKRERNFD